MAENKEVVFVAVSQTNWPNQSRKYFMDILRQVVTENDAKFIIMAGNVVDGKFLEQEMKHSMKENGLKKVEEKKEFIESFISQKVNQLNGFIPKIKGINYHIVVAGKDFDRDIGVKILEALQQRRDDLRIIVDPEAKVPIKGLAGVDYIRVLVPTKALWYYKNISGAMQRIVNSFMARSSSSKPPLILVGCTGVDSFLPFYEGVPCISLPALYKIDEQKSAENTIGITLIKMCLKENKTLSIVKKTYDLNNLITEEKELLVSSGRYKLTEAEKALLTNFVNMGSMSEGTLDSRVDLKNGDAKKAFGSLKRRGLLLYDVKANRYFVNQKKLEQMRFSLEGIEADSSIIKTVSFSCPHFGLVKTLYFTFLNNLPEIAADKDLIVCCGDILAGLEHDLPCNGELLPIALGYSNQELLAAHAVARVIGQIFQKRLEEHGEVADITQAINKCLITFVFIPGNHDLWETKGKQGLPLRLFEEKLKALLLEKILRLLPSANFEVTARIINEKIMRLGESGIFNFAGVPIGISHPHKARTQTMSQRLQEVIIYHGVKTNIEFVGNFHEAASITFTRFDQSIVGVMASTVLDRTDFEHYKQKKVAHGFITTDVCIKNGKLIWSEVEFNSEIDEKDVFDDKLSSATVLKKSAEILDELGLDLLWK